MSCIREISQFFSVIGRLATGARASPNCRISKRSGTPATYSSKKSNFDPLSKPVSFLSHCQSVGTTTSSGSCCCPFASSTCSTDPLSATATCSSTPTTSPMSAAARFSLCTQGKALSMTDFAPGFGAILLAARQPQTGFGLVQPTPGYCSQPCQVQTVSSCQELLEL